MERWWVVAKSGLILRTCPTCTCSHLWMEVNCDNRIRNNNKSLYNNSSEGDLSIHILHRGFTTLIDLSRSARSICVMERNWLVMILVWIPAMTNNSPVLDLAQISEHRVGVRYNQNYPLNGNFSPIGKKDVPILLASNIRSSQLYAARYMEQRSVQIILHVHQCWSRIF